jgi:hypothetical protein
MKSFFQILITTTLGGLLMSGCAGYQLGDVKPSSYAEIEKIHVPPFKNLTLEPRLSSLVTNAVLQEMQSDGTYQVATRKNCDAVLVGEIRDIEKRQLRAVRTDTLKSRELSLYLIVDFHLEDPVTGARIGDRARDRNGSSISDAKETDEEVIQARQGRVIAETIQFVDPSFQVGERNALSFASEELADKLVSQLCNGW